MLMDSTAGSMIPEDPLCKCNIGSMIQSDVIVKFIRGSWIPLDPLIILWKDFGSHMIRDEIMIADL